MAKRGRHGTRHPADRLGSDGQMGQGQRRTCRVECQKLVTWPNVSPSLTARFFNDQATRPHGVMVHWAQGGGEVEDETAGALRSEAEHNYQFLRQEIGVRRLTPRECERLQGFPDDFTLVDWPKARSPKDIEEMTAYFIASGWPEDLARELAKTPTDIDKAPATGGHARMQWLGAVMAAMVKCATIPVTQTKWYGLIE